MDQDREFFESEGNCWFERNKARLTTQDDSIIKAFLDNNLPHPKRVMEVGCSNGYRLDWFLKHCDCTYAIGIEPSYEAICDGREKYPKIDFHRATASNLIAYNPGCVELVIVNFVFHWIDRSSLLKSVAGIDNVLADGGHLIISDFSVNNPIANKYSHKEGLYTYKQDYHNIFLSTNCYSCIGLVGAKYDETDVKFVAVLKKDTQGLYERKE